MDNYLKLYDFRFWLVIFLLTFGLAYFFLPPEVPLYYSRALKSEQIVNSYYLLILPVFVLMVFLLSKFLIKKLSLANLHMQTLIKVSTVTIALISYLVYLRIILLVI